MKKCLLLALLAASLSSAHAVDPKPKRVFVKADCSETLGSQIAASLREAIRASAGYQLADNLDDDGGYHVVLTIHLECTEAKSPTGEQIVSMASIFGTGTCTLGSCHITPAIDTLEASLCSGSKGQACGRDIYNTLDEYMSKSGGYVFRKLVELRQDVPSSK
jgi:hypothetical protein